MDGEVLQLQEGKMDVNAIQPEETANDPEPTADMAKQDGLALPAGDMYHTESNTSASSSLKPATGESEVQQKEDYDNLMKDIDEFTADMDVVDQATEDSLLNEVEPTTQQSQVSAEPSDQPALGNEKSLDEPSLDELSMDVEECVPINGSACTELSPVEENAIRSSAGSTMRTSAEEPASVEKQVPVKESEPVEKSAPVEKQTPLPETTPENLPAAGEDTSPIEEPAASTEPMSIEEEPVPVEASLTKEPTVTTKDSDEAPKEASTEENGAPSEEAMEPNPSEPANEEAGEQLNIQMLSPFTITPDSQPGSQTDSSQLVDKDTPSVNPPEAESMDTEETNTSGKVNVIAQETGVEGESQTTKDTTEVDLTNGGAQKDAEITSSTSTTQLSTLGESSNEKETSTANSSACTTPAPVDLTEKDDSNVIVIDLDDASDSECTVVSEKKGKDPDSGKKDGKKSKRTHICIVCSKVIKCKYNIVRNGGIKHLCDEVCFKKFRDGPSQFLKKEAAAKAAAAKRKGKSTPVASTSTATSATTSATAGSGAVKQCACCQKMMQDSMMVSDLGRKFCSTACKTRCLEELICHMCKKDIPAGTAPKKVSVRRQGLRPVCTVACFNKFHETANSASADPVVIDDEDDVEIVATTAPSDRANRSTTQRNQPAALSMTQRNQPAAAAASTSSAAATSKQQIFKCAVCTSHKAPIHEISLNGKMHKLCSEHCFTKFRNQNKLFLRGCVQCKAKMITVEGQVGHSIVWEGKNIPFCGTKCIEIYKEQNAANIPCYWCQTMKNKFTMVEQSDEKGKFAQFCSLNCLSLHRVNQQAKSNSSVVCNQCKTVAPPQYHLTMSDASVRNFCSYSCVMAYQAKFADTSAGKSTGPTPQTQQANTATADPQPPPPQQQKQKQPSPPPPQQRATTTRRTIGRVEAQTPGTGVDLPMISNVVSLASNNSPATTAKPKENSILRQQLAGQKPARVSTSAGTGTSDNGGNSEISSVEQQIIVQPQAPKKMKNKLLSCRPNMKSKIISCRPQTETVGCQTDPQPPRKIPVAIPVPIFIPVPMGMYNFPVPYPVPLPIPLPIPCFIPTTKKNADQILKHIQEIRDTVPNDPLEAEMLAMAEAVTEKPADPSDSSDDEVPDLPDHSFPGAAGLDCQNEEEEEEDLLQMAIRIAKGLENDHKVMDLETSINPHLINPAEVPLMQQTQYDPMDSSADDQMLQQQSPPPSSSRRGRKRRGGSRVGTRAASNKRRRSNLTDEEDSSHHAIESSSLHSPPPCAPVGPPPDANYVLKFTYGVNAFLHWTTQKNAQIEQEAQLVKGGGKKSLQLFKSDCLQCSADELNRALTMFVTEVRKPNGESYAPDSIFYLCLGIQQYLFENNRIDNIFTDVYFEQFTDRLSEVLQSYEVRLTHQGLIVCRIEEEHLWEAKQLGAHSPHVLLNSLVYFNSKFFQLKTAEDHLALSAASITKHWKKTVGPGGKPGRTMFLRYCVPKDGKNKNKGDQEIYEQGENLENPLRCPVKLYEFFLSKCPEAIRNRNDGFYLVPESSCVPDSPVWYSTMPLPIEPLTKMLNRVRVVKEIQEAHLHYQPSYIE